MTAIETTEIGKKYVSLCKQRKFEACLQELFSQDAVSVEALWFLRGEMMAVLSRSRGEALALEQISEISEMFDDLLPEGLRSRPSPLGRG